MIIAFENQGNLACEVSGTSLQEAQRSCIGITASLDSQLEMITRIITSRIGSKTACGTMLKPLVNRQDYHLASTSQATMIQHTRKIGAYTRIFAGIPA